MFSKIIFLLVAIFLIFAVVFFLIGKFISINLIAGQTVLKTDVTPYIRAELAPSELGSRRAMALAMQIAKKENFAPATAARFYAYVASVYADVLEASDSAQAQVAVSRMVDALAPKYKDETTKFLLSGNLSNLSLSLGASGVLDGYIARSKQDNFDLVWDAKTPEGGWFVRDNKIDKGAMAGEWKRWILTPEDDFFIPAPPKDGNFEDKVELEKVNYAVSQRDPSTFQTIFFWQGATGVEKGVAGDNITPAGVWQNILFVEKGKVTPDEEYANAQKILAQSIADSFSVAWKVKYQYYSKRPSMKNTHLLTLFNDPPFPSYISGHSTISGTAAVVLSSLFPDKENVWKQNSTDARNSRLDAGIHFDADNRVGEYAGKMVGKIITDRISGKKVDTAQYANLWHGENTAQLALDYSLIKLQGALSGFNAKLGSFWARFFHKEQYTNVASKMGLNDKAGFRGVSWSDFDGDGFLDLLVVGEQSVLYHNLAGKGFADVTAKSGISFSHTISAGVWGDFNNDGCVDLFLKKTDESDELYKNNCNGMFSNVTSTSGINAGSFRGYGGAWADYDNDGLLDLYAANYGTYETSKAGLGRAEPNFLYHNNGDGTFSDVTQKAGVSGVAACSSPTLKTDLHFDEAGNPHKMSFQPIWFDYNNDNLIDLFISTDHGVSPLYKNNGNGTFTDVTEAAGLCTIGSNMGITAGDYNNDGNLDLYTTNVGANFFWRNNGDGTFSEIAVKAGVSDGIAVGWGAGFIDYNNDGNLDLYSVNGVILQKTPWNPEIGKVRKDRLYKNNGSGSFTDVAQIEGISDDQAKEAVAFGDFDNNGFTDLAVVSSYRLRDGRVWLYQNRGNNNHWLTVEAHGTKSNRDSVGAVVTVKTGNKTQTRQIFAGSSYISQESLWQTFGVGNLTKIDEVTIKWPSGISKTLKDVNVNQKIVITE